MSFQNIDLQWFAAEDEGRTEEPSEYKLRKAREEGRIPKSQDLNSSVVFFVTVILLIFLAKSIFICHNRTKEVRLCIWRKEFHNILKN